MDLATETLVDGLIQTEQEVGAVLTWAGVEYPCTGGAQTGGRKLDLGGYKLNADVTIVVRTSVFGEGTQPSEKRTVQYLSAPDATAVTLRIDVVTPVRGAVLVLECNFPGKPA